MPLATFLTALVTASGSTVRTASTASRMTPTPAPKYPPYTPTSTIRSGPRQDRAITGRLHRLPGRRPASDPVAEEQEQGAEGDQPRHHRLEGLLGRGQQEACPDQPAQRGLEHQHPHPAPLSLQLRPGPHGRTRGGGQHGRGVGDVRGERRQTAREQRGIAHQRGQPGDGAGEASADAGADQDQRVGPIHSARTPERRSHRTRHGRSGRTSSRARGTASPTPSSRAPRPCSR